MLAFTKPDFPSLAHSGRMAPLPPGLAGLPNWLGARYFGLVVRCSPLWAIRAKLTADCEISVARPTARFAERPNAGHSSRILRRQIPRPAPVRESLPRDRRGRSR